MIVVWRCRGCIEEAIEIPDGDQGALVVARETAKLRAVEHAKTCPRGPSNIVGPLEFHP